jgi:hypothetical protein
MQARCDRSGAEEQVCREWRDRLLAAAKGLQQLPQHSNIVDSNIVDSNTVDPRAPKFWSVGGGTP